MASKDVVLDPDAVCAVGATRIGWRRLMIGVDETVPWHLFPLTPTATHRRALAKRILVQKLRMGRALLSRESLPSRHRKIYVPIFDGEIENQSV